MPTLAGLRDECDEILPRVIADRRYLHERPELAYAEHCLRMGTGFEATVEVEITAGYPGVVNHSGLCEIVREAATRVIGSDRIVEMPPLQAGGRHESIAWY